MFRILYILWLLLPLSFFLLALWAVVKPALGVSGRENAKQYSLQGFYCALGLALAIAIDQASWFEGAIEMLSFGWLDISVARWLLYPALLVLGAYIQRYVRKEEKQRNLQTQFKFR